MKKCFTFIGLVCFCLGSFAQSSKTGPAGILPKEFNPWNVQKQFDQEQLLKSLKQQTPPPPGRQERLAAARTAGKGIRQAGEEKVDTVEYFAATQSYRKNYVFTYEGGDIATYNVGIAINGTKVTFKNLFNLYNPSDYTPSKEYTVDGTYDPETKTITIPTPSKFSNATVIGEIGGYLVATLVCGTVDEKGNLAPDDKLVFDVIGDFDAIKTTQSIGVGEWTKDGSQSYGIFKSYRNFYAALPKAQPQLIAFNDNFDFGETFPNTPVTRTLTLINIGKTATDYAVNLESDADSWTASPASGTIEGLKTADINFTFDTKELGDYEGISTFDYETEAEVDPIMVQLTGSVKAFPDYSAAVKKGDFKFTTGIEYPFEMQTLSDGTQVAASATHGMGNATSKLGVAFTVPEGNIGRFSWKGKCFNQGYWYSNAGGYFVDGSETAAASWTAAETDISNTVEFGPGEHSVRFQYDSYRYSGVDDNKLYVYDLTLENTPAKADDAELKTKSVDFGSFITDGNNQVAEGTVELVNRGINPLKVTAVSSDNKAFSATKPNSSAAIMKTLSVPVLFSAKDAAEYKGKLTIETTAGTFEVPVEAIVREMPDFSQIVSEGKDVITFTTDPTNPFIVEDGVAYNASANKPDYKANTAWFEADFEIPAGKVGYLSWEGHSYGTADETNNYFGDYSIFEIRHPQNSATTQIWGDGDAGSDAVFHDEDWKRFLTCIPGKHAVKFQFYQIGDSVGSEKDRLEISDIKLHIVDYPEYGAELQTPSVKFDSVYVGPQRYATAKVVLLNTGSKNLGVKDVKCEAPFYAILPKDSASFGNKLEVELWFYPGEEGEFTGQATIQTNAGDFTVDCSGATKSSKGILLNGDVEDQGYLWGTYDADQDGEGWNLGYNLFGGYYPEWCHGGQDCFGSASYSWYNGDIQPDNWLFSPSVTIPSGGATLRWFAASHNTKKPKEHYSVYIEEADKFSDASKLNDLTPVFSETLDTIAARVWQEHTIDLKDYAGKTVCVAFRHHDCKGQYVLKIDDILIFDGQYTDGIQKVPAVSDETGKTVVRQEIYDMTGRQTSTLSRGINLIRKHYADGTVQTFKIFRKE